MIKEFENILTKKMDRRQFLVIVGKIIILIFIITIIPWRYSFKKTEKPKLKIIEFNPHNLKIANHLAG